VTRALTIALLILGTASVARGGATDHLRLSRQLKKEFISYGQVEDLRASHRAFVHGARLLADAWARQGKQRKARRARKAADDFVERHNVGRSLLSQTKGTTGHWGRESRWGLGRYFRPTKYLRRPKDRARHELTVDNRGLLRDATGALYDTKGRAAIAVISPDGRIYARLRARLFSWLPRLSLFVHSSFLANGRVAFAGEIVAENGRLQRLGNRSGHYKPGPRFLEQALVYLQSKRVDLRKVTADVWDQGQVPAINFLAAGGRVVHGSLTRSLLAYAEGKKVTPPRQAQKRQVFDQLTKLFDDLDAAAARVVEQRR
jgi:hypothetical protein